MTLPNPRHPWNLLPRRRSVFLITTCLLLTLTLPWSAAQLVREANNTLRLPPEPVTSTGQPTFTDLLQGIEFDRPVAIRTMPGNNKSLFIVERVGIIKVIDDLDHPVPRVFMDIRDRVNASDWKNNRRTEGLTSFAFHPNFQSNGRFFVTYCTFVATSQSNGPDHHNRLSEFRASDDRSTGLPESEIPYITQYDEGDGHNINDAHFGPDGYLYVATGDEGDGGTGDDFNNAQKIDKDFFSAIMRIDVDNRPGNLPPNPHPASSGKYSIPADNPFVGATSFLGKPVDKFKIHDEFWAVGFRNPWRISFDPVTGKLYEGDVGQHAREEINLIVKGGNYGWSFKHGTLDGPKAPAPAGFTFIDPIFEYRQPEEGYSVTGGVVYRGSRIPSLYGFLIFADYQSGTVWALDVDHPGTPVQRLFTKPYIAGFGYDPRNGEVIMVNHDEGKLYWLDVAGITGAEYPTRLSETGVFSDLSSLTPNPGIVPYEVNLSFWSDGALKRRWFSLPDQDQKIQFSPSQNWTFPPGAVWIKHFDLQTSPNTVKRVETRVLVKTRANVYGLSYKWDDSGANADLVPDVGDTKTFTINDGSGTRNQTWRFPSRAECQQCHTPAGGYALGFNTAQLNLNRTDGSVTTNQIGALAAAGYLENPPPHLYGLMAFPRLDDETVSRTYRVKAYLAANCSQCHQPAGTAHAQWNARLDSPLSQANIINGGLYNNPTGNPANKVVAPGSIDHSAMFQRISVNDRDRMPPIGSTVLDQQAIQLLRDWITQDLPSYESYAAWASRIFPNPSAPESSPQADADEDGVTNYAEYLAGTDPRSKESKLNVATTGQNGQMSMKFTQPAHRAVVIESTASADPQIWQFLQAPGNAITFPAQPSAKTILDLASDPQRFYRLRIIEP